jgi:hypothetical protein
VAEATQRVQAREIAALDPAARRVLDGAPARTDAWGGLEGRLVLPATGTRPVVAIREPDSPARTVPPDAMVALRPAASDGAERTWRELWDGRR